ncbi:uncharacterized protein LOC117332438 [Pecten maximus]|uniref:uncharacterized protein LOC117332438 n=1 Tax=Pecten maximus TaxID=6579 RepID=UPI0014582FCB|nr:uncharacterized protein LOC117332438 [Pecten maximus]
MAASMCNVGLVRRQLFLLVKRKTDCRHLLGERCCSSASEGEGVEHEDQAPQSPLFVEDDYFGVSIPEEQWSVPRLSGLAKDDLFKKYQSDSISEAEKHKMHYVNMRFGKVRFDNVPEIKHHKDTRDKFHDFNQVRVKMDILNSMNRDETETNKSGEKYFVSFMDQFKKDSNDHETSVSQESDGIKTIPKEPKIRKQKAGMEKFDSFPEKFVKPMKSVQPRWNETESIPPSHVDKQTKVEYGDSNLKVSNVNMEANNDLKDAGSAGLNFIDQQYFQQEIVPTMPKDSTSSNLNTSQDNYSEEVIPEFDPDLLFSETDKEIYLERNKLSSDKKIRSSYLETEDSESFPQTHPAQMSATSSMKTVDRRRTKKKHERFSDLEMLPPQHQAVPSPTDQADSSKISKLSLLETADTSKTNSNAMNFIDQQFFGEQFTDEDISGKTSSSEHLLNDQESASDLNFIDEEYFKEAVSISTQNLAQLWAPDHEKFENKLDEQYFTSSTENEKRSRKKKEDGNDMDKRFSHLMQGQVMDDLERDAVMERKRAITERNENGAEDMLGSAYDSVQKLKLERNQATNLEGGAPLRDSKGMKVMKTTVPQLHKMTTVEIVHMITRHILYDSDDIVAIYKPYGLPTHGGPGIAVSVAQLKEQIGQNLSKKQDTLYMVHRLDKETTGVMLLARTKEMAARLSEAFRDRRVIKKYWVITKGTPNPPEGIIDIPMMEGTVDGKNRMALRPNFLPDGRIATKTSIKTFKAETYYKVRASHENTAIVECLPLTDVRHQLRAHLSFGLNTPILGDHKFSNLLKFAPQKLDSTTLRRLGVQQSKVRHIPLHLHAMSILIPEFLDGRNLFVTSNLPKHFCKSMRYLKLNPRQK